MQIIATDPQNPDAAAINAAVTVLRNRKVVAYMTDTLYGLGGDACSMLAIAKVFALKGRSTEKALPVIIGEKPMLWDYVEDVSSTAEALIGRFWPGPLTLIFKASEMVPAMLIGNTGKIAIRLPAAQLACEISKSLGAPIIATSANRSGEPASGSAQQIAAAFGKGVELILDSGPPLRAEPSTILDVTMQPPRLVRTGAMAVAEITQQVGELQT
jgi:L-threonylcarbamoyladenylate synthase